MSVDKAPKGNPVKPPIVNKKMNANAYNIGVFRDTVPWYIVPNQLKTLIADGIETVKVKALKTTVVTSAIPDVNMWWPHTKKPNNAIAIEL